MVEKNQFKSQSILGHLGHEHLWHRLGLLYFSPGSFVGISWYGCTDGDESWNVLGHVGLGFFWQRSGKTSQQWLEYDVGFEGERLEKRNFSCAVDGRSKWQAETDRDIQDASWFQPHNPTDLRLKSTSIWSNQELRCCLMGNYEHSNHWIPMKIAWSMGHWFWSQFHRSFKVVPRSTKTGKSSYAALFSHCAGPAAGPKPPAMPCHLCPR